MAKTGSICVLVLCFLKIEVYSCTSTGGLPMHTTQPSVCQTSPSSTNYEVQWPSTSTQTSSIPLCLNKANELSIRKCIDGQWEEPEPECVAIQQEPSLCPENFTEVENVCYIVTQKSTFPSLCPFPNVLPFEDYIYLIAGFVEPIWMPVTRDLSKGLGFMRWIEPSTKYNLEYPGDYSYDGTIKDKNCMVFTTELTAKAVSCYEEYQGVCAYRQLNYTSNVICSQTELCVQRDFVSKTKCLCAENSNYVGQKAEFIYPYQNNFAWNSNPCNFGMEKSPNGTYLWPSYNQEISYTYWAPDATFYQNYSYAISTPNGWTLSYGPATCTLTISEVKETDAYIKLSFDNSTNVFHLFVNNSLWLQKLDDESYIVCFTDASSNTLLYRYPHLDKISDTAMYSEFQFRPITTYSGYYWCEAFKFSDSTVLQSEKFFYNASTFEFVGFFRMKLPPIDGDPLSPKIISYVNEYILSKLNSVRDTVFFPRFMGVLDLNEASNWMYLNVHFTSNIDITDAPIVDKELLYHNLEDSIRRDLSLVEAADLIILLSTDFCIGGTFDYGEVNLTWPTTFAYDEAFADKFCFRDDGNLVKNFCGGNFNDGVFWMTSTVSCKILPPSQLTGHLLPYFQQVVPSEDNIYAILELQDDLFNALDIFLTVEIFMKHFFAPPFDFDLFAKSLEKILKLNPWAVAESQFTSCSTDKILAMIKFVMRSSSTSFEIVQKDFIFVLTPNTNISGVVITSSNGQRNLTRLQGRWTPQRIVDDIQDLEIAIWLSPTFVEQTDSQIQIGLMFFFNDTFFPQHGSTFDNVTTVFGMLSTNSSTRDEPLVGPVSIISLIKSNEKTTVSCVNWVFDIQEHRGLWMELGTYSNQSSYHVCSFWQSGYFSVASNNYDNYNVTADLESLLDATVSDTDKLNKLADISQNYQFFNSIDIAILGKVLDLVQNNTNNDLNFLGRIIDNMHRVPQKILNKSQEENKATDLILYNIDTIIKNNNLDDAEIKFVQDNFAFFVNKVKETNFTGLILREVNESVEIETLKGDSNIANIQSNDSFSSLIFLSPELINQIPEESKIIITIFFSDVLFNGKSEVNKSVSTIFGVILPDIGNYSGPLTILHSIPSSDLVKCAHWNYSTPHQFDSYWQNDSQAANSMVIQCDFWHTTHFAILLFNNDHYDDYYMLDLFTTINSAISLTSLLCIIFTGILFEKWRKNIGNQILLNFSVAIILQIVTFYVAETMNRKSDKEFCTVIGVLLHYSVVSQFCWMLTIAFLQFKRFVIVFAASPKYLLLKACVCGWILPLLPVMLALVLNNEDYTMGKVGLCYPSGLGLYLGVWVPVGIIGLINLVIFIYVIYNVFHTNSDSVAYNGRHVGMHQWKLFVLLFFMLGLTWCFGFLSGFDFGIVFAYMFCFTATLQGFILFVYFIVCNANTRRLYIQSIKKLCSKKGN